MTLRPRHWLYSIVYGGPVWLHSVLQRSQSEAELDEELSFHLERQIQEDIDRGIDPAEARHRAQRGQHRIAHVKQECRDVRRIHPLEDLVKDALYAFRTLRNAPVFAVTAALTIALGIGMSTAIFSVTDAVLLRPLPYPDSSRLFMALRDMPKRGVEDYPMSSPDFADIRNESMAVFEEVAAVAIANRSTVILKADGTPEQVHIQSATSDLLPLLGAKTILGRGFSEADGQAGTGQPEPAILSYEYWQRRYGGDQTVVGRPIPEIGAVVIGVTGPGFELLLPPRLGLERSPDVWLPLRVSNSNAGRNAAALRMIGRLKPGMTIAQAQPVLDAIAAGFEQKFAVKATSGFAIRLEPMRHYLVAEVQPTILALTGSVVFLLLIACANVANLLLIRTSTREREFAMRASLGGTRFRLTRQLIAEALVLAGIGGTLGVALAWAAIRGVQHETPLTPGLASLPRLNAIGLTGAEIAFAVLATAAAAVLLGAVTAWRAARPDVIRILRSNGAIASSGRGGTKFRNAIVTAEIALSFVLLTGSGLMFRSFLAMRHIGLGYDPRDVLIFRMTGLQRDARARAAFGSELESRLRALPEVKAVTSSSALPLAEGYQVVRWGKEDEPADTIAGAADYQSVRPGYFEALHTPILEGRGFMPEDDSPASRVIIVDDLLAAREFPQESALGKRLLVSIPGQGPQRYEIIGIVPHLRNASLAEIGREQIYSTEALAGYPISGYWAVRTSGDRAKCTAAIRAEVEKLDKNIAVSGMPRMLAYVERAESKTRFSVLLIGVFAAIAALLAGLGLYGILATMVRQRTSEIGIRVAMGATPSAVFRLVVGRGMLLSATGLAAGVLTSLLLTRAMTGLLVGVHPADPLTFLGTAALFLAIAVAASWLPARRAAALDPAASLKE